MTKAVVIVNPSSGRAEGEEYGPKAQTELEKMYDEVELRWTEKEGDATDFAREAAREHVDAIYALGGDGTVNECVNGIAPEDHRPPFGFIPLGTVNDLGRVLGIPMNPDKAVKQLTNRRKKAIDIGKINQKYFVDIVAIGSIPEAVHSVPVEEKTKLGPFAYIMEGLKALSEKEVYPFAFDIEGKVSEVNSFLVVIALTNSVAGIPTMIPEASEDDGYLHLLAVKADNFAQQVNLVPKIFAGKIPEDDEIFYRKFTEAEISLTDEKKYESVITNVDGDEGDHLPIKLKVFKQHMQVFVPDNADE
ncbi:lipid kinase, YegS/Rv2252/BmrU family [Alkalibacterium putridalgicola]|uniref:Diacylglycerol kinase n=1 Tax=Alkalibacterium putridalgicola TaxID=426703 RepID=A0A1H7QJ78_9LACT|nr:diacylglycerol kinase family protein [Alkalibacterium putridalgicola]GEK88444.1 diacylglycerol kinase [Alkalibacterium putridalgicola]SEL48032.1 lipid kinase, YegS/Rv2252/BmrU family [Alkalibacterium putridalgicola]